MDDAEAMEAQVVLPCSKLPETLRFFTQRLGFRLDAIFPADDPRVAVLSGYGVRLRLERDAPTPAGMIRLACENPAAVADGATELLAPNGTRVLLVRARPDAALPPLRPSFVLTRGRGATFAEGRAGMRYRDLLPDRQGGRFIASHIRIPDGGPVADDVHFHEVAFQMIYCARGWVRVVYEDQGPPFVLQSGDCVLQPPRIRHRVLESSPALEVIELSCPAEHETHIEHALSLPASVLRPDRDFGGQRFLRHLAAGATWRMNPDGTLETRDVGMAEATGGLASACVTRSRSAGGRVDRRHDGELLFSFVLAGSCLLQSEGRDAQSLESDDAFSVPAGHGYALLECSLGFEVLEVSFRGGSS